jgi:hypothetical protein
MPGKSCKLIYAVCCYVLNIDFGFRFVCKGAYVLELDNKGSTLKSKEVEFAAIKTNIIDAA